MARPAVADLQSKRRALQKNVAVENYRLRLNNGPLKRKPEREPRPAASLDEAAPQARQGHNLDILELFSIVICYIQFVTRFKEKVKMNENEKPKASDLERLTSALYRYANRPETKNEFDERRKKTVKKLREKQAKREAVEKPAREKALANPFVTIPPDALLTLDDVKAYSARIRDNDIIADYYRQLAEEQVDAINFENKAHNIENCARQWFFDVYRMQGVRDLKNIFLCKDKFCHNCQTLQQAVRLTRFSPILEDLTENGKYIYHIVFTVPNVPGIALRSTVSRMKTAFSTIIRYFRGFQKLSYGLHNYGFLGGIRGLEVTTPENEYHAHFHCALAFDKPLFKDKDKVCKFSYDYRYKPSRFVRMFSSFEILLQKIWYCLMNDIAVTPENVEKVKDGYSVTCDEVVGTVYEVFKYVIKFEHNDEGRLSMTYEQFKTLYRALKNVHVFQGYGCFRGVADPKLSDEELEKYNVLIQQLRLVEDPELECEQIHDLMLSLVAGRQRYITRRTVDAFLKEHPDFMPGFPQGVEKNRIGQKTGQPNAPTRS